MSTPRTYTRVILAARPTAGQLVDPTIVFNIKREPLDLSPDRGEVLVKTLYFSLDPTMRGWIQEDGGGYMPPIPLGSTMRSMNLGVVVRAGEGCALKEGEKVRGFFGWSEYTVVPEEEAKPLPVPPAGADLLDYMGPLGYTSLTAYFGLKKIGQIEPGETLVVSGAAGAVGATVCQIGKKWGAKVYGIAGGREKCEWLERECGVVKALDYKSASFQDDFKAHVGKFDVYFDNVGGEILDFLLTCMNRHARIVICGAISGYNSALPTGLHNYLNLMSDRARMEGFIILDHEAEFPQALQELGEMLAQGDLKRRFHVVEGIENAPEALNLLYTSGNTGKLVVKVGA